ncbi:Ger(x)C family spore germination protein [Paenibacillus thiaminolyticus]|uniref:Ger(X)C family spore germination protein n=1 Tax=Paenibacillus thiaminolyticus TaxID=49283 RepID=A0AAP9DWV7_PANTH|nr:Ger(x)C family spore germination protein [Paenibacillus thiaminolyticus]MCY9534371.1 Ger(x)C family spore germination protein [Paenibacillus thiaminolyticus]MCY9602899.1 Ger(x)C family spore germination protein [Paenibacillus thiaminolyticus]MCY9608313.1 Ger(x)C family spore germination protein [Paenibacillus thiaminolyticus]MCY9614402.1 Ger(x)C family spore germination protein [Paenibacillus thiaminolyticus]MCY9618191.1 Ger(x)C family spore germination protein [Paenibacillus thiaminolyticu
MNARWKQVIILPLAAVILVGLPGCWDAKNIQDMNYIAAIGIDYEGGKYVIYTQSLDFMNVAKQETKSAEPAPIWVGRATGYTLEMAINAIYNASPLRVLFEHTSAVIITERAMKHNVNHMLDALRRYREVRYTPWVFGTKEPLDKLLSVTNVFNISPITSLLHHPEEVYQQSSFIAPIQLQKMAAELGEPNSAIILPSLITQDTQWVKNGKPSGQYLLNGAYILVNGKHKKWLSWRDLMGLRWLTRTTARTPVVVGNKRKPDAVLSMYYPKSRIQVSMKNNQPVFHIKLKVSGHLDEMLENVPLAKLRRMLNDKIEKDIRKTFEKGLEDGIDIYNLKNEVYRKKLTLWKALGNGKDIRLTPESIASIKVSAEIHHSGAYKYVNPK